MNNILYYRKRVSFNILKRGTKYFLASTYENGKMFKVLINQISTSFEVGKREEEVLCRLERSRQLGLKSDVFYIPIAPPVLSNSLR